MCWAILNQRLSWGRFEVTGVGGRVLIAVAVLGAVLATSSWPRLQLRLAADPLPQPQPWSSLLPCPLQPHISVVDGPLLPTPPYATTDGTVWIPVIEPGAPTRVVLQVEGDYAAAGDYERLVGRLNGRGWQGMALAPQDVPRWGTALESTLAHAATLAGGDGCDVQLVVQIARGRPSLVSSWGGVLGGLVLVLACGVVGCMAFWRGRQRL